MRRTGCAPRAIGRHKLASVRADDAGNVTCGPTDLLAMDLVSVFDDDAPELPASDDWPLLVLTPLFDCGGVAKEVVRHPTGVPAVVNMPHVEPDNGDLDNTDRWPDCGLVTVASEPAGSEGHTWSYRLICGRPDSHEHCSFRQILETWRDEPPQQGISVALDDYCCSFSFSPKRANRYKQPKPVEHLVALLEAHREMGGQAGCRQEVVVFRPIEAAKLTRWLHANRDRLGTADAERQALVRLLSMFGKLKRLPEGDDTNG